MKASSIQYLASSIQRGSYYYNEKEDALRVKIKPVTSDKSVEWLKYDFISQTDNSATIALLWEKLMIHFKVETDLINNQLESFRRELQNQKGFQWQAWDQAAQWAVQNNVNLDEALLWSDSATSRIFGGDSNFQPWATKAQILDKLGKTAEAEAVMKKALPIANMQEMHQYGRQPLQQKKNKEALQIFKTNLEKNPNQFTTLMGLTRGYSANGDYKNALKYAKMALPLAPNQQNKTFVETGIRKLEEGKDMNQ